MFHHKKWRSGANEVALRETARNGARCKGANVCPMPIAQLCLQVRAHVGDSGENP